MCFSLVTYYSMCIMLCAGVLPRCCVLCVDHVGLVLTMRIHHLMYVRQI